MLGFMMTDYGYFTPDENIMRHLGQGPFMSSCPGGEDPTPGGLQAHPSPGGASPF